MKIELDSIKAENLLRDEGFYLCAKEVIEILNANFQHIIKVSNEDT